MWFYSFRNRRLPASGLIIKEKTEILSKKFPDENKDFKASKGWLHTSLNYKMLHSKTLAVKADEEVFGTKKSKEHMTCNIH